MLSLHISCGNWEGESTQKGGEGNTDLHVQDPVVNETKVCGKT